MTEEKNITNKEKLEAISEEISKCEKCILSKTRKNTVPGSGSAEAEVVFVGEAPGFHEDEKGVPFCGAAGKFLDQMLEEVGWSRESVFIANTLKCRPPENRDPEDDEKSLCREYLERQIEIIDPKLIVCLGRHSVATFLPGAGSISQTHGKAIRRPNGRVYFVLYHPAAALHNGGLRQTLIDDFKKIPLVLKKIKEEENSDNKKDNKSAVQQKLI